MGHRSFSKVGDSALAYGGFYFHTSDSWLMHSIGKVSEDLAVPAYLGSARKGKAVGHVGTLVRPCRDKTIRIASS